MSSVDNRIVILTFDNKDFESNANKSIETLDKLKKGLKLEDASKGLTNISKSAKGFSLSGMTDAIDTVNHRFSTLGVIGATVISQLTKTAMSLGTKLIGGITQPLIKGGWNRALNIEQAKFQLEGLGVAWDNIKDDINYGVKDTAYGLDAAAKAASQLVASNVQLGDEMKASLRGISGVAAMTSSSYEDISQVFTRVAGQGRVMAVDLNSLAARGLNAAATLGKYLNKTEAEVREMVHKGQIDFKTFAAAMDDAFGQHAKDANKTFTGALANVKAALSRIGADVASNQLTNLRDIFNALIPLIDNIHAALGPLIEAFNKVATKATEGLVKVINFLNSKTPAAKQNIKDVQGAIKELSDSGFNDFAKLAEGFGVTEAELKEMVDGGRVSLKRFVEIMDATFGDDVPSVLDKFREEVTETNEETEKAADGISKSAEEIEKAAQEVLSGKYGNGEERRRQLEALGMSYEAVQNKVNELLGCSKRYEVAAEEVADAEGEVAEGAEEAAEKVDWLGTNAEEVKSGALTNLGDALKNIGKTLAGIGKSIGGGFKKAFSNSNFGADVSRLSENFRDLTSRFILNEDAARGLTTVFEGLFNVIKYIIKGVGWVLTGFMKLGEGIGWAIGKVLEFIGKLNKSFEESGRKARFLEALGGVIRKIGEILVAFKDKVVEVAKAIGESEGFQKFREAMKALWEVIKGLAGRIFDKIIEKMNAFANWDPDFSWMDKLVEVFSTIFGAIGDFIMALINGEHPIQEFFKKLASGDSAGAKFLRFLAGIKDGIVNFFKNIDFSSVSSAFGSIGDFFKGGLEKIQNSEFFKNFIQFFKDIYEELKKYNVEEIVKKILSFAAIIQALRYVGSLIKLNKGLGDAFSGFGSFMKGFNPTEIVKAWKTRDFAAKFRDFSIGVALLAGALFIMSKIPVDSLNQSVKTLVIIIGTIAGIAIAMDRLGKGRNTFEKFAAGMIALGFALIILAGAMKIFSIMKPETIIKGSAVIAEIVFMLAIASRVAGKGSFGTLIGFALAIAVIVPAVMILGKLKISTLVQGATAISSIIMVLAIASRIAGTSSFGTLAGFALAIVSLTIAVKTLGKMDTGGVVQGATAISSVIMILAIATRIMKGADLFDLLGLTGVIIAITAALSILGKMEMKKLVASAGSLAGVVLAVSGAMRLAGHVKAGSIIGLVAVLGSITAAFYILQKMSPETVLSAATGISMVALTLGGAIKILVNIDFKKALPGILSLGLLLAEITGAFIVLKKFNVDEILEQAVGISIVAVALSTALGILVKLNVNIGNALSAALGFGEFLGVLVGVLEGLGALTKIPHFNEFLDAGGGVFVKLGEFLGKFVGSIIEGVGEGVGSAIEAVGTSLSNFATNIEPFLEKMSSLGTDQSILNGIDTISNVVIKLAGASFMDAIGKLLSFGNNPYEELGNNLISFADVMVAFSNKLQGANIDNAAIETAAKAGEMLSTMASSVPNSGGLLAAFVGDNDLATFALQLIPFADAIVEYSNTVKDIDTSGVEASANAGKMLTEMADTIPNSGLSVASVFLGDNTMDAFGEQIVPFAQAIVDYANTVKDIDTSGVEASVNAGKLLTEMADTIPNSGLSVASVFLGDNTMDSFAEQIVPFAEGIVNYANTVKDIDTGGVEASVSAGKMLTEMADTIPNSGGLISFFAGDNQMEQFGEQLVPFGRALARYSRIVSGNIDQAGVAASSAAGLILSNMYSNIKDVVGNQNFFSLITGGPLTNFAQELDAFAPSIVSYSNTVAGINQSAVSSSVSAATILAEFYDKIKDVVTAGLAGLFEGQPLVKFGKELCDFGPYLAGFAAAVEGINVTKTKSASSAAKDTAQMMSIVDGASYTNLVGFGESLEDFGASLGTYADSVASKIGPLQKTINVVRELVDMVSSMSIVNPSVISNFGNALGTCATTGVNKFIQAFSNGSTKAYNAGKSFIAKAKSGVAAASASFVLDMFKMGENSVKGFIRGMDAQKQKVSQKATEIANIVKTAVAAAQEIRSPSRVMARLGRYSIMGLIAGIEQMEDSLYAASAASGNVVLNAVANPLAKIQKLLDDNIDYEPVITPVLDLSNLNTAALNNLFGNGAIAVNGLNGLTYGGSAQNAAANISSSRTRSSNDVVNAINEMRSDINRLGDYMTHLQVRLDGRKLVGEIITPIDNALGARAVVAGRRGY